MVKVIRTKALERDNERAKVGKDPTTRKIELVPEDFAPGADAEQVIEKIAEAQLSGAIKTNQPAVQLNLEDVGDVFAARVKKDTARLGRPVDVSGLRHAIDTQSIRHAFNRHGPGNERSSKNEPISPEVVSVYLDVVRNYDEITDVRTIGGAPRIKFEKRVDGVAIVVEEMRTAEGTLSFFSMWIEKR